MPPTDPQPVAVVTGGNRGIGLEVCRQLAQAGWRIILTAREPAAGSRAAARLAADGLPVLFHQLDVTDHASIAAFGAYAGRELGHIDALVNNAGVSLRGFNADVVTRTLAVNFYGAMRVTDELLPCMASGARVVMVSSGMGELSCVGPELSRRFLDPALTRDGLVALVNSFVEDVRAGRHGAAGWPNSAYRVSKVALNALTRLLAPELRSRGILVNAVCPGWVRTRMGGTFAARSPARGADTIVWAATLPPGGPSGQFFRDRKPIAW